MFLYLLLAATSLAQTAPQAPRAPRPPRVHSAVTHGMSKHGYLGVGVGEVTDERAKALKLPDSSGVEVRHVSANSPAAKAGIKEGDVILEVNGQKADDIPDFIQTIGDTAPDTKVTLTIWRDGARHTISATVKERPATDALAFPNMPPMPPMPPMPEMPNASWGPLFIGQSPRVGFEGETLSAQLAEYFGVKEGVLVRTVSARTPAEKAGLKAGDVITKVNGTPVTTPREISGLVRANHQTFTFTVVRNHKEITLNLEIAGARLPSPEREVL